MTTRSLYDDVVALALSDTGNATVRQFDPEQLAAMLRARYPTEAQLQARLDQIGAQIERCRSGVTMQ